MFLSDIQELYLGPCIYQELLAGSTGSSIQGPQSNVFPCEASVAGFCDPSAYHVSQSQLRETGGHEIVQTPRFRRNRTSARPKVRPRKPWCADCNREFARNQEFKRHMKDVHGPSRQCPLCDFKWIRPDKIKAHIVANHQDKFAPEVLDHIRCLCGRQIVAFVDDIAGSYGHDLDTNAATSHPSVSQGSSLP